MTKTKLLELEFRIGEWLVHPQLNRIERADRIVTVEPKVMEVLVCLAEQAGKVLSKEIIIQSVWTDTFVTDDVLIRAVSQLRRVFEDDKRHPSIIRTIPRRGYQLIGQIESSGKGVYPLNGIGGGNGAVVEKKTDPDTILDTGFTSVPDAAETTAEARIAPISQNDKITLGKLPFIRLALGLISFVFIISIVFSWYRINLFPEVTGISRLTYNGYPKQDGMATDGIRIFFSEARDGRWRLASIPVNGGESTVLDCPISNVRVLDISPDGLELLVEELDTAGFQNPVWLVPVAGGEPFLLGNVKIYHGTGAAWSPAGDEIAYSTIESFDRDYSGVINIVGRDGLNPRTILTMPHPVYNIRWSPDGKRIRFNSNKDFMEVSANGGKSDLLLPGWQNSPLQNPKSGGVWTLDGKYFFFCSMREGLHHLWVLRENVLTDGYVEPKPFRLTPGPIDVGFPVADPKGKKIYCLGSSPRAELCRYDKAGETLEPFLSGVSAEMSEFSRDGQWVTYVKLPEAQLIRSRIDGRERIQLTSSPLQATLPAWSPDGREIAFTARMPGEEFKIYLISADGKNFRPLLPGKSSSPELGPSWSPNGQSLLFEQSSLTPDQNSENFHIYDLKTTVITDIPDSGDKACPRWSPDGRYIAATEGGFNWIVVYDFETQTWRRLCEHKGAKQGDPTPKALADGVFFPTWSQDSQSIFYIDWAPGLAGYYRIGLSGGEPELIMDMHRPKQKPRMIYSGTLGGWIGLAPDDSPIFALHTEQQEIYSIEWQERFMP